MTEETTEQTVEKIEATEAKKSFLDKISRQILLITIAVLGILLAFTWLTKVNQNSNNTEKITELQQIYKTSIDSLNLNGKSETVRVFSWAVRAEVLDGNYEEVNLLLNEFVKFNNVEKLMLVEPETRIIKLSTDKKLEGELLMDKRYRSLVETISSTQTISDSTHLSIMSPIMNLDKRAGILIVEISK